MKGVLAVVLLLFLLFSSVSYADVGDRYCSQLSSFTQRCVMQDTEELKLPSLGMVGFGEMCWKAMSTEDKVALVGELQLKDGLDSSRTQLATAGFMPTTFESSTEMVNKTYFDEETKRLVNYTVPAPYNLDFRKPGCFSFVPGKNMVYSVGFGTANFTTTDYVNGTCDAGCSIDVDLELTNVHANTSRQGLVAEYLFTDYAFDTSDSGGYDGTIIGANCSTEVTGKVNSACSFDGINDDIRLSNGAFNDLTNGTVMFWINYTNHTPSNHVALFTASRLTDDSNAITISINYDNLLYVFSKLGGASQYSGKMQTPFPENTWTHVTWVKDGANHSIYMNGIIQPLTWGTDVNRNVHFNTIGGTVGYTIGQYRRSGNANYMKGGIDEFGIWDRALTSNEINKSYGNGNGNTSWIGTEDQLNNGSIAYWKLDGNANDTRSANDGTVVGATHKHERYEFDGVNDYISVSDDTSLDVSGNFTIGTWIKPEGAETSAAVIAKGTGNFQSYLLWFGTNKKVTLYVTDDGSSWGTSAVSTNALTLGQWYYISASQDTVARIYVNGVEEGTDASPATPTTGTGNLLIGARYTTTVINYFNGSIDELQIWDRTLSVDEIAFAYNNSLYKYGNQTTRTGTYSSIVFNGTNRVTWRNITVTATNRTAIVIQTRTSEDTTPWEAWKACLWTDTKSCQIQSTPNTLLEYKLTINTDNNSYTPVITNLSIDHITCIETWTATGWVFNGSLEYRDVTDASSCGSYFFMPASVRVPPTDEVGDDTLGIYGLLFLMQFMLVIGLALLKLYNLMKVGAIYTAQVSWVLFISGLLAYGVGFITALVGYVEPLFSTLLQLETWFMLLFVVFHISEVLLYLGPLSVAFVNKGKNKPYMSFGYKVR